MLNVGINVTLSSVDMEKASLDWSNAEAVMNLTKVLLKHDYQIEWDMPLNHLCPPVTNRANYIHWINDLLELNQTGELQDIVGIDVGTGASCIYPLLGHRINGWKFIATDIDEESLKLSRENIMKNDSSFGESIFLTLVDESCGDILNNIMKYIGNSHYLKLDWITNLQKVDFTMCNPPFFDVDETINRNPKNDCRGNKNEMITVGGEEDFVVKMIDESVILLSDSATNTIFKNCWFTSMLGKKRSLQVLKEHITRTNNRVFSEQLTGHSIIFHSTEFIQGKTTRWGIAWKFEKRAQIAQSQIANKLVSSIVVQRTMYQNITKGYANVGALLTDIYNVLKVNKDFITVTQRDSLMATIKGHLDQDKRQAFEIAIIQSQPKKWCVQVSYKGPGPKTETSHSFSTMYELLSKQIFAKCV